MLEIFQYEFIIRSLIAGSILGLVLPVLGIFLVVKRYSNLADTLSHVSLVGILTSIITGLATLPVTILSTILVSLGIEKIRQSKKLFGETALAVTLSASLGLTAILLNFANQGSGKLFSYLFGGLNFVSLQDVIVLSVAVPAILITLFFIRNQMLLISLDEDLATSEGVEVEKINYIFITLCAVIISLGITSIGVLLISTLMVVPVISAQLFKLDLVKTILLAVLFSVSSIWFGIILSFYLNLATGGVVVIINLFFFFAGIIYQNFK